jgi:hypothetical protein
MNDLYKTAKYWLDQGIATIPLEFKSKKPRYKWFSYTQKLPTENDINFWFSNPFSNIGIITGWNDLTILDFDDMGKFNAWALWVLRYGNREAQRVLNDSRIVFSGRGAHVYVYCANADNMKLEKIDILAHNKFAVIPPSIHPKSNKPYELFRDVAPITISSIDNIFPIEWIKDAEIEKTSTEKYCKPTKIYNQKPEYDPWVIAGTDSTQSDIVEWIKSKIRIENDFFSPDSLSNSDSYGRYKITRCPFHDDHNPSFWIDTEKQICGCYSGCTPLPLDAIDLFAKMRGISNREAIGILAQYANG